MSVCLPLTLFYFLAENDSKSEIVKKDEVKVGIKATTNKDKLKE